MQQFPDSSLLVVLLFSEPLQNRKTKNNARLPIIYNQVFFLVKKKDRTALIRHVVYPQASTPLPWKINSLQQSNSCFLPLHYLQFPTSVSPCEKYLHCKTPPRHGQWSREREVHLLNNCWAIPLIGPASRNFLHPIKWKKTQSTPLLCKGYIPTNWSYPLLRKNLWHFSSSKLVELLKGLNFSCWGFILL